MPPLPSWASRQRCQVLAPTREFVIQMSSCTEAEEYLSRQASLGEMMPLVALRLSSMLKLGKPTEVGPGQGVFAHKNACDTDQPLCLSFPSVCLSGRSSITFGERGAYLAKAPSPLCFFRSLVLRCKRQWFDAH